MTKLLDANCQKTFPEALKDNLSHTIPEAFYAALAVFSAKGIQFLSTIEAAQTSWTPYLHLVGPTIIAANTFGRISEINEHEKDQAVKIHAFEETLSQTILNSGVYIASGIMLSAAPAAALPVLGTFVACEFLLSGDNAPIDYLRSAIADVLHTAHVGDMVDYIF